MGFTQGFALGALVFGGCGYLYQHIYKKMLIYKSKGTVATGNNEIFIFGKPYAIIHQTEYMRLKFGKKEEVN